MTTQLRHHILRTAMLAAIAGAFTVFSSNAQLIEAWRLGGFVNVGRLYYATDLRALPGVPSCCPQYKEGDGPTYSLGLSWGLPLFSRLALEGRLSFANYNGKLEADEYELVTAGRDTVTATFGHSIEVSQPALGLDALFAFEPLPSLKILGGARGELMLGGTFHQEERILSPDNIRFENDQRLRLVYDADLPTETLLHFSVVGGVRYEIALNRRRSVLLAPEILYWQDFSDVIEDQRWQTRGFRLGLTLQFIREKTPDSPTPLDPLPAAEAERLKNEAERLKKEAEQREAEESQPRGSSGTESND